jgi:hypothetical protein
VCASAPARKTSAAAQEAGERARARLRAQEGLRRLAAGTAWRGTARRWAHAARALRM